MEKKTSGKAEPEKHPAYSPLEEVTDILLSDILVAWGNYYLQMPFTEFF